jgi:mannose/fructose-specific phosphotransferase system component IIA
VQIKIGIQNSGRELIIESDESVDAINQKIEKALAEPASTLTLTDEKGGTVIVPAAALAYIEIAAEQPRKVGFVS